MVVACVAITDCITSLPSALSTATEMVLWWTSRPIYLMLSIGCSFREVKLLPKHSNHNLLRKGRPFIMRAPHIRVVCECAGTRGYILYSTSHYDDRWGIRRKRHETRSSLIN